MCGEDEGYDRVLTPAKRRHTGTKTCLPPPCIDHGQGATLKQADLDVRWGASSHSKRFWLLSFIDLGVPGQTDL